MGDGATFPVWAWVFFFGLVALLLFVDLFILHRKAREIPFREALVMSGFWILISLAFGAFIWSVNGPDLAGQYFAAYLVEWSLSLDNVFVFSVVFTSFAVPREYRYHVLFLGVMGALVFRAIFVVAGIQLLNNFTWLVFIFGLFLIFTGVRMFRGHDTDGSKDYRNGRTLRILRRFIPMTKEYQGENYFIFKNGKRFATPLLAVLVVIEMSDLLFAIDSVPAVLSITSNTFIAYSSIAFAILGLRALYFALEGLVDRFTYLHYGLAIILAFVGVKFILDGFGLHIPTAGSLIPIAVILLGSIGVSLYMTRSGGTTGSRRRVR